MTYNLIKKPEKSKELVRLVSKWYWEATGDHWYPEKRAIQYVLCRLGQHYDISKKPVEESEAA
ncbi:hypothetical protein [Fimbriiglobus ruber]|uniref:hypothetical protein n=1 Tax=Fimbriiglobus ruber TaxID=1908690 RepID=UPI000B4BEA6B|nr:hypothetical protein [Fimbriiglobus ruber]